MNKKSLEGLRILVVEDNILNREIVQRLLCSYGALTETAEDGCEAVDMFLQNVPFYYDAILMDIQMPNKNGLVATREIRASNRKDAKKISIVAMTADTMEEELKKMKQAGMDDCLSKPFDIQQVVHVLTSLLHPERL